MLLKIRAREILDSRGNPTVQCDVTTEKGTFTASVPSGASTGKHESLELRDKDRRYGGKGVLTAVKNINTTIASKISDVTDQTELDNQLLDLDGSDNKSNLGANALLGVSMAGCRAFAAEADQDVFEYIKSISGRKGNLLPLPQMNLINSGKHAGIENDIQEHMIVPRGQNFAESLRMGSEIHHALRSLLKKKFGTQAVLLGDEGGYAPRTESVNERLTLMEHAIDETGYTGKVDLALDCAASEFHDGNMYIIRDKKFAPEELIDFYAGLVDEFKIVSIEDGFDEDDWATWEQFTKKMGRKIQIIGDDLLVTNVNRIDQAIASHACNSLLLKVNQIGTVSESIKAAQRALDRDWTVVVSHRSGETEDSFIADLVVGLATGQSKFGAPARSDRNAKYNRLLAIEEKLGDGAQFPEKI